MAKVPFRFKRVTEAFDELARLRPCESSGTEHSAEDELSDLIDSFMEREGRAEGGRVEDEKGEKEGSGSESDIKEMLQRFLGCDESDGDEKDGDAKRRISVETDLAWRVVGTASSEGFKRRLMSRLRERGLDAGLCKSRWQKTRRIPSGDYEYIDVILGGTRFIVEVDLVGEFTIARPTEKYQSLLDVFPQIFVVKPKELKQVVRLMCNASRESIKSSEMHLPPWRKNGYLMAKWFGSYRRTTNAVPAPVSVSGLAGKRSVGFETSMASFQLCRGEFARKVVGVRVGYLAQELEERNF